MDKSEKPLCIDNIIYVLYLVAGMISARNITWVTPPVHDTKWLRPQIEASLTCSRTFITNIGFANTNTPKPIFVTRACASWISFTLIYNIFLNYLKFMVPKKRSKCVSSFRFGSVPRVRTGYFGIPSTGIQPYWEWAIRYS